MKKLFIISLGLLFSGQMMYAQRSCGVMHHHEMLVKKDPTVQQNLDAINKFTEDIVKSGQYNKAVITIPVVVHVVYNTTAENVSTAQIQSQIDVLNKDFRKTNTDASLIPSTFAGIAADAEIQFCLASVDPNGAATSGIIRKSTTKTSFTDDDLVKSDATGGSTAWNSTKYLNLWVCDLGSQLLGYAQFPGGPASTDGVVINYTAFGTTGSAQAPFNKGRTTTHEIGHWLNLYHIGGDTYGGCGSDQVSDTPTQKGGSSAAGTGNDYGQNYGCPTHPLVRSGECSGTTAEMFMNYMDYTDDACMYMFTTGQKNRMQALFAAGGFRNGLTTSNGCGTGGPVTPSYCAAAGTNTSYEWINNVTLGTINNTTGANGGYADFTAQSASLAAGSSYSISLKPAFASSTYSEYFNVYIDYNGDKDFDDAGELAYSSPGTTTTISGSFTVPASATTGATRMRVIMKDGSITGPCISYTYGEVEDYTVNITSSAPTCNAPTGLSAGSITSSGATLSWTAVSGATSYSVQYKTSASSTWTTVTTSSTSYALSGLSASTTYNWQVSTTCSSGTSAYTSGTNFTTSAAATCGAPSGLSAGSITTSGASLSWTAVSGATSYTVQYKTSSATTWTSVTSTTNSRSLTGLTSSTVYNWRVYATCSSGNSTTTTGTNFTTLASGCTDSYESNNTQGTAKSISVNTNISASIGSSTDVDWFKYTTTSTYKNVKIQLTNLPFDYDVYLYNGSGVLLGSSENGSTTSESIIYNNATAATYYVKVVGYNGANSTSSCYTLRVNRSSIAYKINPYATEETVAKEDANAFFTVMPNPSTDGKFNFKLNNIHTGDVNVEVYDESGRMVQRNQFSKTQDLVEESIDLSDKNRGMYIVRIYNDQFNVTERILYLK